MASIICDNAAVKPLLQELVAQVLDLGGRVSDYAEIVCRNGNLSIECSADASPETELCFVPEAALIPMSLVSMSVLDDQLVIQAMDGELDPRRRSLLDLMVRIFNITGKIRDFREASPRLSFLGHRHILEHLLAGRQLRERKPAPGTLAFGTFVAVRFFKARVLGYRFSEMTEKTSVLMPILDSLNHHPAGAGYRPTNNQDGTRGLAVSVNRPVAGSKENFARYGFYDALDTYLQYTYVDENTRFLRSVPCEFDVAGVGRVTVQARPAAKYDGPLAKELQGLRIFMPRVTLLAPGHIQLSQLIVPWPERRFTLRRILVEIFKGLDPSRPGNSLVASVVQAEQNLLARNLAYYQELERMIDSSVPDSAASTLRELVAIQRARIKAYVEAINRPGA